METQNDDLLLGACSLAIISISPDRPHHPGVFFTTEHCCEGPTWNWKSFPSLERTLMLGKIEGRRIKGWQKMRWLDGITDSMDMFVSTFWEMLKDRETWHVQFMELERVWHNWVTEQQDILCIEIHNLHIYTQLNHIYFYFLHYIDFIILIYFWNYGAFAIPLNNGKNGLTYIHNYI